MKKNLFVKRELLGLIALWSILGLTGCAVTAPTKPGHRPDLLPRQQYHFSEYLDNEQFPHFKAFAVSVNGPWYRTWAYNRPEVAVKRAMRGCGKMSEDCQLYAIGEHVVAGLSEEQFSKVLQKYYKETLQIGDPETIKQLALNSDDIEHLVRGYSWEGIRTLSGIKVTMEFWPSGHLVGRIVESKTRDYPPSSHDEGKWWIKGDFICLRFKKWLSSADNCGYVVKEADSVALYTENFALGHRMTSRTELTKETDPVALLKQGIAYRKKDQYDRAIVYFNKAIEINRRDATVYNYRGLAYESKGQYDRAIADYTKAIEIDPRLAPAYSNRGILARKLGRLKMACSDWKMLCELGDCSNYEKAKREGDCK